LHAIRTMLCPSLDSDTWTTESMQDFIDRPRFVIAVGDMVERPRGSDITAQESGTLSA
jgi:hypothetical protein